MNTMQFGNCGFVVAFVPPVVNDGRGSTFRSTCVAPSGEVATGLWHTVYGVSSTSGGVWGVNAWPELPLAWRRVTVRVPSGGSVGAVPCE
jgi:hypothetical protein